MLAFINNLGFGETVLMVLLGILLFGRRLPEVARELAGKLGHLRRAVSDVRREVGLDQELRGIRQGMTTLLREEREDLLRPPSPTFPADEGAPRPPVRRPAPPAAISPPTSPAPSPTEIAAPLQASPPPTSADGGSVT